MKRLALLALCWAAALRADQAPGERDLTLESVNFAILVLAGGYFLAKTMPPFFRSRSSEIRKEIAEAH